jgi:hypothetical protein
MEPDLKTLPKLIPLARSLTSDNPEAVADFFFRYFVAHKVAGNLTKHMQTPCIEAATVELRQDGTYKSPMDKYAILLVKGDRKWAVIL